jgi:protoheme ferro-lyase
LLVVSSFLVCSLFSFDLDNTQSFSSVSSSVATSVESSSSSSSSVVSAISYTVIPYWYHRKGYISLISTLILNKFSSFNQKQIVEDGRGEIHILFSAHGVPESYIRDGDLYQKHIEHCFTLISHEVQTRQNAMKVRGAFCVSPCLFILSFLISLSLSLSFSLLLSFAFFLACLFVS